MIDPKEVVSHFDSCVTHAKETIVLEVQAYIRSNPENNAIAISTALRQIADEVIGRQMLFDRMRINELLE